MVVSMYWMLHQFELMYWFLLVLMFCLLQFMDMVNIGLFELIVVLVIVLLVFGLKRFLDVGKSLGKGMCEFKDALFGESEKDVVETKQLEVLH